MNFASFPALATVALLAGCANLDSIYRSIDVGAAHASSIDAKQRAIVSVESTTRQGNSVVTRTVVCPEVSPDALAAITAAAGLTYKDVQAALSSSETAASIGLRTQSIQLMRDELAANCFAFMNGAITQEQAYLLHRRSQNFTLGILAIEQLTGAVKADQVALSGSSSAATGSDNVDKETSDLEAAKSAQNDAKTAADKSKIALADAKTAVETQTTKERAAKKVYDDLNSNPNPDAPTKTKIADALTAWQTEQATLASKQRDLKLQQADTDAAQRKEENADALVVAMAEALKEAKGRVRSMASTRADIARSGGAAVVVTDKVATTVLNIVDKVLQQSGQEEACLALMAQALQPGGVVNAAFVTFCSPAQITTNLPILSSQGKDITPLLKLLNVPFMTMKQ